MESTIKMVYPLLKLWFMPLCRTFIKKIDGIENIPKAPFILIANHSHQVDPLYLVYPILKKLNKKVHFIASPRFWFLGETFCRKWAGCIPLFNPDQAYKEAKEIVQSGEIVGIFPEGHLKNRHNLKTGAVRLAFETQTPILPIRLFSSYIPFHSTLSIGNLFYVTHNGEYASAKVVKTYVENRGILDDLDVRASDLLQANGVVWLEGPSDRLYFNRWVELWTEGLLKEGTHYQCVFYGGRLLSHLSARSEEQQETIDILNVNKNALLLIDSDKARQSDSINSTKQRLVNEIEAIEGKVWVTAGREIENYIHREAINTLYGTDNAPQVRRYDKFENYLERFKVGEGKKYQKNKVLYAEEVLPGLTKQSLSNLHDVREKMEMVINEIKKWNSIS